MLPPIPARILRSTATVEVCLRTDMYQRTSQWQTYTVSRVHLQPTAEIRKTPTDTDQQLRAVLFVDGRLSSPQLEWDRLLEQAHEAGGDVFVTVRGTKYTVESVDALRDDTDHFHHWEIQLV